MAKSRSRAVEDRFSELPDSLILEIFEFLPTIDVVRTTLLSHRWRNLWNTIRRLSIDCSMYDDMDKLRGFVNGFTKFWRGNKIIRFRVALRINKSAFGDIDSWVRFVYENAIEDLDLSILYSSHEDDEDDEEEEEDEEEVYWLPQYMYLCSSLKKLSIQGCNVEINGEVQWSVLKRLEISDVYLDENVVNKILLGTPQLEEMYLCVGEGDGDLSICSSSLRRLAIEKLVLDGTEQLMDSQLRIGAPNLKKLRIWGVPYSRYLLQDISSLTLATLGFHGPMHHEYHSCPWNDFLGQRLREIFPAIQHVEKVMLSDWTIQVLGAANGNSLLPPCPNVKILKLKGCLEEYEQILSLLEKFPNLTRLKLEAEQDNQPVRVNDAQSFLDFEFQTSSFLSQLRTVKVSWIKGDTSFYPLAELVLKYASRLEKVVFHKRLDYMTSEVEVSSFCIRELPMILTKSSTRCRVDDVSNTDILPSSFLYQIIR